MRRILLLGLVLLGAGGCYSAGGVRRKPGGNVTLPARVGLVDQLLGSAACALRQRQDSANLARGVSPQARDSINAACGVRITGSGRSTG